MLIQDKVTKFSIKAFESFQKNCIFAMLKDDNCTYPVGQAVNLLNISWAFFMLIH